MDKKVFYKLTYGMFAVGVMDGERPCGCIVNTVIQITSSGTIAVSMNRDNYTHGLIQRGGRFAVSILGETAKAATIGTLGFHSGKEKDKFEGLPYELHDGLPILKEGANGYLLCTVTGQYEAGTHTVFFAQVEDAFAGEAIPSMTYEYYRSVVKGSAPKNAPTYQEPQKAKEKTTMKYICSVCQYEYEGDLTLEPDDYTCPVCGVGKDMFVKVEE